MDTKNHRVDLLQTAGVLCLGRACFSFALVATEGKGAPAAPVPARR